MTKDKDGLGKRLAYYIKKKGLNKTEFTKIVKMDYAHLHRIIKGQSEPGMETLKKILNQFPDLSLNWLVSGKGDSYEPTQEEMYELDELHVLTTERDLSPISCLNNYLKEQFEWYSNQGPRDLTPLIDKAIKDFIYFSENSRSHYIHKNHTEKNGITD